MGLISKLLAKHVKKKVYEELEKDGSISIMESAFIEEIRKKASTSPRHQVILNDSQGVVTITYFAKKGGLK